MLRCAYRNCRRYILLRNPWGSTEATVGALDSTVEIGTFKKYFAGFGVVS